MTGRKRKGHQAVPRERFDLGPQRREMDTVVDGERGDAASPGLVVDERPARVESDLRITTLAVDPHHARSGVMDPRLRIGIHLRSEEHTSELQSLMRISYAVFCLKTKKQKPTMKIRTPP